MTRESLIKELELSMENRNEYRRALGYGVCKVNYEVINEYSLEELEDALYRFRSKEKYYRNQWWNR